MSQILNNTHENIFRFLQFFIAGFAGLAYQIVSFKLISSSGIGDAISVAISLTAFVSLSGLGSLLGGRLSHTLTGWFELAVGAYASIFFGLLIFIGIDVFTTFSGLFSIELKLIMFLLIIAPLSIISGMLIPLHQERLPKSEESNDFLRFFFVYTLFHVGGGLSLILIDLYGFRNIGWLQVGFILGLISFFNGISIIRTKNTHTPFRQESYHHKTNNTTLLLIGLFFLSIITGYVGIISYRLFDYLVETNIRNYTVVTALIFFGLTLSALISNKIKLSFRGILGATSLGILSIFTSPIVIPPLSNVFISNGIDAWWIYGIAGCLLIIPLYALIGISIPSTIRLGVKSSYALCVASIGNAIGYWVFIITAHYNVDTYILLIMVFLLGVLSTRFFIISIIMLGSFLYQPISDSFHSATHQIFLHNYIINEKIALNNFWKSAYNDSTKPIDNKYDVNIISSWNTYGWATDHIEFVSLTNEGKNKEEFYILSGIKSLSLLPPEMTIYDESIVASIPAFLVENKSKALVLGSGTGISANVAAKNFDSTDVVDISPDTSDILEHFDYMNGSVLDDINLIKQDALSFILSRQKHESKYNYIFSTVTGAGYPMSSLLYTRDFFKSSANILEEDGVFSFWVDRRFGYKQGFPEIMKSLKNVFPYIKRYTILPKDVSLTFNDFFVPYQVIVASKSPLEIADSNESLFHFIRNKHTKLKEVNGIYTKKLLSVDNILENRYIKEPLNISTETQSSGVNSMEYAYSYLSRYKSLENLYNNLEIYKERTAISKEPEGKNENNIREINYEENLLKETQKEKHKQKPFDFSPDSPLDPEFDPGPDFDKKIETDLRD